MTPRKELINAEKMQIFIDEIEEISGKNSVIALDVFFVHDYHEVTVKSFTYAVPFYRRKLLPEYLNRYGTMGKVNSNIREVRTIINNNSRSFAGSVLEFEEIVPKNVKITGKFEDLLNTLKNYSFGKSCLWINIFQKVGKASANLSIFLILNSNIKPYCSEIKDIVQWKMLTEFYRLIMNEFIGLNETQGRQLSQLQSFQDEIDNYAHNIFNIFPDIINGIGIVSKSIPTKPKEQTALDNEIKRARLLQIFFKIIGGREIREIKDKSIWEIILLLNEWDISHKVPTLYPTKVEYEKKLLNVDYIPRNAKSANDSLNIIWNLWHNARKYSSQSSFSVTGSEVDGRLAIKFENIGQALGEHNCNFLKNKVDFPKSIRGNKSGLAIVRRKIEELEWNIIDVRSQPFEKDKSLWKNTITILTKRH